MSCMQHGPHVSDLGLTLALLSFALSAVGGNFEGPSQPGRGRQCIHCFKQKTLVHGMVFHARTIVSSPDLMDGRGAEDETSVTTHIAKLGRSRPYQTALGPHRETSWVTACLGQPWHPGWDRVFGSGEQDCLLLPWGNAQISVCGNRPPHYAVGAPPLRLSLIPLISISIESKLRASYVTWGLHHYTRNWNFLLHQCCHY